MNLRSIVTCFAAAVCFPAATALAQSVFPPSLTVFDLADNGFGLVVNGAFAGEELGSRSGLADINNDGHADLLIGSEQLQFNGQFGSGGGYVVYGGSTLSNPFDLRQLYTDFGGDGTRGFVLRGTRAFAGVGNQMGAAGDLNNDGIDDLYINTAVGDFFFGALAVFFGRESGFAAEQDVSSLASANGGDGTQGVLIRGIGAFDVAITGIFALEDFNGDGINDLLYNATGRVFVVFGRSGGWPAELDVTDLEPANGGDGSQGVVFDTTFLSQNGFTSAGSAGDVNHDGLTDIILSLPTGDPDVSNTQGVIVYGWANDTFAPQLDLRDLLPEFGGDGSRGVILQDSAPFESTGRNVASIGDINGDGVDDVAIGAPATGIDTLNFAGRLYVVYGSANGLAARIDLDTLRTAPGEGPALGFVIEGGINEGRFGAQFTRAGDLNGDGEQDLIVSQPGFSAPLVGGRVWAIFGPTGDLAGTYQIGSDALGDAETLVVNGPIQFGHALAAGGDVNNDGAPDILVTSRRESSLSRSNNGRAYVMFGRKDDDGDSIANAVDNCTAAPNATQIDADNDGFGNLCDADLNNDCIVNVVDLGLLRSAFFSADPVADLNSDGVVNVVDLGLLRAGFFAPPGPSGLAGCN